MKKAKKFKNWITHEVIPSIRKYRFYQAEKKYKNDLEEITKKYNYTKKENELIKNELKTEKFPNGGMVYAINYSDEQQEIYRIGKTGDMNVRKNVYNTHTLFKRTVAYRYDTQCPMPLETCVRAMLYKYSIKDRKDFYGCSLKEIEKSFTTCIKSLECMNQTGGSINFDKFLETLESKITVLKKKINDNNIELNKKIVVVFAKTFPITK